MTKQKQQEKHREVISYYPTVGTSVNSTLERMFRVDWYLPCAGTIRQAYLPARRSLLAMISRYRAFEAWAEFQRQP